MWMAGVRQPETPTVPPPPIGQSELFQPCSADPTYRLAVSWKTEKESDEFCNTFYLVQAACGLCSDQSRLSTASDSCMRCSEAMSQINAGKLKVFGYGLLVWLHLFIFRILILFHILNIISRCICLLITIITLSYYCYTVLIDTIQL